MRLFFALWPPHLAREQLAAIARTCAGQFGGQPTREDTIHLTLSFLGEVPEAHLPLLVQRARQVRQAPFDVSIDCLGYWARNRLLWAGCKSPAPELLFLNENLQKALGELAPAGDPHRFAPHLTLVRKLPVHRAVRQIPEIETIRWRCSGFALVLSRLGATGSHYENVIEVPFSSDAI
jgi:2'-5' RNA ligase